MLFGIGQGINIPNLLTTLTNNTPEENRAMVMSLNSMSLRLGQTLGPPLFGMVFASRGIEGCIHYRRRHGRRYGGSDLRNDEEDRWNVRRWT